jgi:uncharacterized protein YbbK (DUF523 family)
MNTQLKKIKIGISSCLLGFNVRYDGGNKWHSIINDLLHKDFEWVPICPEVEGGLSIPRPPIQIELKQPISTDRPINSLHSLELNDLEIVEVNNKETHHTQKLFSFALEKTASLNEISGFISKSKSPSCGIKTPYFYSKNKKSEIQQEEGPGFFIKILKNRFPNLPIIDEIEINNPQLRNNFIRNVLLYSTIKRAD